MLAAAEGGLARSRQRRSSGARPTLLIGNHFFEFKGPFGLAASALNFVSKETDYVFNSKQWPFLGAHDDDGSKSGTIGDGMGRGIRFSGAAGAARALPASASCAAAHASARATAAPSVVFFVNRCVNETHSKEMTMPIKAKAASAALDRREPSNGMPASDFPSLRARLEQLRTQERALTGEVIALEQNGGRDQTIGREIESQARALLSGKPVQVTPTRDLPYVQFEREATRKAIAILTADIEPIRPSSSE
jgi:hypothetical protein